MMKMAVVKAADGRTDDQRHDSPRRCSIADRRHIDPAHTAELSHCDRDCGLSVERRRMIESQ
jgi:hypothetical protein